MNNEKEHICNNCFYYTNIRLYQDSNSYNLCNFSYELDPTGKYLEYPIKWTTCEHWRKK